MYYPLNIDTATEIIRLKVSPEKSDQFIQGRFKVDEFMQTLNGFKGTEILQINETDWLVLIRWDSQEAVIAAQKITADAQIISNWLETTKEFVAFETGYIKYHTV